MQKLLLLSGIALLSLTSISLSPKPAMAGCGWGDITCSPENWTCPLGGCPPKPIRRGSTSEVDIGTSTFQKTCNNISISGNILSANCRRSNGEFIQSYVILKGIENINGLLTLTLTNPDRDSNYHLSCTNISMDRNLLSATCKTANQMPNKTAIPLNGIENIDGILKYTGSP
jgi:CVNH domain